MRVELLHHPGCRSAQAAHQLVEECLLVLGISIPVLVRAGDYPSPNAREMNGFGLCLGLLATVTLSEVGPVRWPDVIGRVRRGVPGMGGGSR